MVAALNATAAVCHEVLLESKSDAARAFCTQPAIKDCVQYCTSFCASQLGDLGDLSQFLGAFDGFGADCSDAFNDGMGGGDGYYGEGGGITGMYPNGVSPFGMPPDGEAKEKEGSIFPVLIVVGVLGFMCAPPPWPRGLSPASIARHGVAR